MNISQTEWMDVARQLPTTIAYSMWDMGEAVFTDSIPTAACVYNAGTGAPIQFLINPEFWAKMTIYDKAFIIAHECLHALYEHGRRTFKFYGSDAGTVEFKKVNIAADLVINHSLIDLYGFEREKLSSELNGILFIDATDKEGNNIFPPELTDAFPTPSRCSTESILRVIDKFIEDMEVGAIMEGNTMGQDVTEGQGDGSGGGQQGDGSLPGVVKEEIAQRSSQEDLEKTVNQEDSEQNPKGADPGDGAGRGQGNSLRDVLFERMQPTESWSDLMKWKTLPGYSDEGMVQSWIFDDRRFVDITCNDPSIILPSEHEDLAYDEEARAAVMLFLDVSGSCHHFVQPFFDAFATIPREHFEISLHTFDDGVRDIANDIDPKAVRVGGGTYFPPIGERVKRWEQEHGRYPDMVWVFTDGQASGARMIVAEHADNLKRWYWFLDKSGWEYAKDAHLSATKEWNMIELAHYFPKIEKYSRW